MTGIPTICLSFHRTMYSSVAVKEALFHFNATFHLAFIF